MQRIHIFSVNFIKNMLIILFQRNIIYLYQNQLISCNKEGELIRTYSFPPEISE